MTIDDSDLKPWIPARGISPLATQEERARYQEEREAELRSIIKGPSLLEDSFRAQEELHEWRFGARESDEQEWEFGR